MKETENKTIAELSVDAQTLYKHIVDTLKKKPDATITYGELSDLIGADVTGTDRGRGFLNTARRKAMKENSIVTDCVKGVGIRRVIGAQFAAVGESDIERSHRLHRRSFQKLSKASGDDLKMMPAADLIRYNTVISMHGALYQATAKSAIKAVENKVSETKEQLPTGKTLELFLK